MGEQPPHDQPPHLRPMMGYPNMFGQPFIMDPYQSSSTPMVDPGQASLLAKFQEFLALQSSSHSLNNAGAFPPSQLHESAACSDSSGKRSISSRGDEVSSPQKRAKQGKVKGKKVVDEGEFGTGRINKFWESRHDDILIPFLAQSAKEGKKVQKGFKSTAFAEAAREVNRLTGSEFTAENVKIHYKSLRSKFHDMVWVCGLSGAGWDEDLKMIKMSQTWMDFHLCDDKLNEKNKQLIREYVNKPLKHYSDMLVIIGDDFAKGEFKRSIYENCSQPPPGVEDMEENATAGNISARVENVDANEESNEAEERVQGSGGGNHKSRKNRKNKELKKKRDTETSDIMEYRNNVLISIRDIAQAVRAASAQHWMDKLSVAVFSHQEFPEETLVKAFEYLAGSGEGPARIFIGKPATAQSSWIAGLAEDLQMSIGGGAKGLSGAGASNTNESDSASSLGGADDEHIDL